MNNKDAFLTVYKLTDYRDCTRNQTQWGPDVTHTALGGTLPLCTNGWLHFTYTPELAVLLDPNQGNYLAPTDEYAGHLWRAMASRPILDDYGLKGGTTKLTTIERIDLPTFTREQDTRLALVCAKRVYTDKAWCDWADDYLENPSTDRLREMQNRTRVACDPRRGYRENDWAAFHATMAAITSDYRHYTEDYHREQVGQALQVAVFDASHTDTPIDLVAYANQYLRSQP